MVFDAEQYVNVCLIKKVINQNKIQIHNQSFSGDKMLLIDGFIVGKVEVKEIYSTFGLSRYGVFSEEVDSNKIISKNSVNEFRQAYITSLSLKNWAEIGIFSVNVSLEFSLNEEESSFVVFELLADLLLWNRQYTFIDYLQEFEDLLNFGEIGKIVSKEVGEIIKVEIETSLQNETVLEEIENNLEKVIEIHYKTLDKLDSLYYSNSILASFNFPEDLKVPCEQYLLYFAQFLQDLGINATSNLKEEAGKVLFSVTPTDDVEALDKIREALAVYLNLPSSPIIYDDSFAAMRLKQQVDNLQHAQRMTEMEVRSSQYALRLANQTIEHQDKIIQQKDTTIEQQNKIIERITDKAIMINSAENKEELEEIFDGVKVGKSKFLAEQLGLHLNPATAIKSVGKKIVGKVEIISLDLDKDE